jgi:hypothetical protein
MIRAWFRALVKKALSSKVLQQAPRRSRRGSVRPHLEALEDRLVCSISELAPAWPSIPVAVAANPVVVGSQGDPAPLPDPTAPAGDPGVGHPGWEGLLRDVLEAGPPHPATALSSPTNPTPPASESVIASAPATFADGLLQDVLEVGPPPPAELTEHADPAGLGICHHLRAGYLRR